MQFIFKTWKKLDELNLTIKTLWIMIGILIGLNGFLVMGWMREPQHLRIYLPPDLSQGAMLIPDNIPKSTIYAFAYQIFTAVTTWTTNGTKDYKHNIESYKNYLTPDFYHQLKQDISKRQMNGSLDRQRLVSGVSGMGYRSKDVQKLGAGTWLVTLHLNIQETVNGSVVKNVEMNYPLIISRIHTSIQVNPWGLSISGFYQTPKRIKTLI